MKILTLCYEYPPIGGGGGKVVAALSRELVRQGEEVDILTMHYREIPYTRVIDGVHVIGVPCLRFRVEICTPFEMLTYLLNALPIARKLIRQNHYDLIHAHFALPDGALAYWLNQMSGLPYIITAYGSDVPGYNPNRFRFEHVLLFPFWRAIIQKAAAIVTASSSLANLIQLHLPNQPVERIFNGFSPPPLHIERKDPLHILVVSRLFERKGVQYLLQALDGVTIPYRVDIVGAGPYQSVLEKMAKGIQTKATITFRGWIDQDNPLFWQLMESAAIFVFPSEAENFPMVLLEAMAAQMAIITTNNSGCAEVVGDAAIIVPPKDAKAIRTALEELANDPLFRSKLGKYAQTHFINNFSIQAITKNYIKLYNQIIGS